MAVGELADAEKIIDGFLSITGTAALQPDAHPRQSAIEEKSIVVVVFDQQDEVGLRHSGRYAQGGGKGWQGIVASCSPTTPASRPEQQIEWRLAIAAGSVTLARMKRLLPFSSTMWIRPKLSAKEIAELEKEGLIVRRRPRSSLFLLTRIGAAAKERMLGPYAPS